MITAPARAVARRVAEVFSYSPRRDGRPDPGEVVWTWVPYEENPRRGRDRPVLVIGRRRRRLLALMLTSTDHQPGDPVDLARGRQWMDIGSGDWDRRRRPSEVRLDRLLVLDPAAVRREGAALDRETFARVVAAARPQHWLRRFGFGVRDRTVTPRPGSAPR